MINLSELSEFLSALPPGLAESATSLITILKAVGIAFIIYVAYLIIKAILGFKMSRRIKRIEEELKLIEIKLDNLTNLLGSKRNQKKEIKKIKRKSRR